MNRVLHVKFTDESYSDKRAPGVLHLQLLAMNLSMVVSLLQADLQ